MKVLSPFVINGIIGNTQKWRRGVKVIRPAVIKCERDKLPKRFVSGLLAAAAGSSEQSKHHEHQAEAAGSLGVLCV